MKVLRRIVLGMVILLGVAALLFYLVHGHNFELLNPKGLIARRELNLLIFASLLSLLVVIPVFTLLGWIVWHYRASNQNAKYTPNYDHNRVAETIWWVLPIMLILILASATWTSTHELDPYKPLASNKKPITIQVVALDWKWLFIYPDANIATVNYLRIPTNTPINFEITSDAPMNSLWIPQLGGQIYAMAGMTSQLHLNATDAGIYTGSSANLSGRGFAGMKFKVEATDELSYEAWLLKSKRGSNPLTDEAYAKLSQPSENNPVAIYSSKTLNLYGKVVMKYMMPADQMGSMQMAGYDSSHE